MQVSGTSDCGDGTLDVSAVDAVEATTRVELQWVYRPAGRARFTGSFVVPSGTAPGAMEVIADAFCLDADYESTATVTLLVTAT